MRSWALLHSNNGSHIARIGIVSLSYRGFMGFAHLAVYSSPGRAISTQGYRAFSCKPEGRGRVARRGACRLSSLHSCHQWPQLHGQNLSPVH